ncbi:hypothetical protein Tco_0565245 [Tanacetum coccineum]
MFDDSPNVDVHAPEVIAPIPEAVAPEHAVSNGSPSSTTVDQDAPTPSNSSTQQETQSPIFSHDVEEDNQDIAVAAHCGYHPWWRSPTLDEVIKEVKAVDPSHSIVEATLQVFYESKAHSVLHSFPKSAADAPEIYMQEFWASVYVTQSIGRFKMITRSPSSVLSNTGQSFKFALKVRLRPKVRKNGSCDCTILDSHKLVVTYVMEKDPTIPRHETRPIWHNARDDPLALTNEDIPQLHNPTKRITLRLSGTIPPKNKRKQEAISTTDAILNGSLATCPEETECQEQENKRTSELENISRQTFTEAEQLKIVHQRSHDDQSWDVSRRYQDDDPDQMMMMQMKHEVRSSADATDARNKEMKAVKDSNTDLDGRDKVMTDVEDTHVTLTPVNLDGQQ